MAEGSGRLWRGEIVILMVMVKGDGNIFPVAADLLYSFLCLLTWNWKSSLTIAFFTGRDLTATPWCPL